MYNIISQIINHSWISSGSGDQQYIYYISGALIIILCVTFVDLIYRVFRHFWRSGR